MTNQFYKGDIALLEIQTGVFTEVKVLEVIKKFGKFYYRVSPVKGTGEMTVLNLKSNGRKLS